MSTSNIKLERNRFDDISTLPVLPVRDVVIYPRLIVPLYVTRLSSIAALERVIRADEKRFLVLAQRNAEVEDPQDEDLYEVGTVCSILQILKTADGAIKVLVEGEKRGCVHALTRRDNYLTAVISIMDETTPKNAKSKALINVVLTMFRQYAKYNKNIAPEMIASLSDVEDPGALADAMVVHLSLDLKKKQKLLEMSDGLKRLEKFVIFLKEAVELLKVEKRISSRMRKSVEQHQKEHFLREQMAAIQEELDGEAGEGSEHQQLETAIDRAGMSVEALKKAKSELRKLKLMHAMSPEATVCRNYLDCLVSVPWKRFTKVKRSLKQAEDILDKEHYGLEKIKERIVEYLAVQDRVKKPKGSILCFVGPPGVGKTSLGRSIANATGRKFAKMSLGGVHDEAEIRGHRRTYIGALPGKIVQNVIKSNVRNPLFLLDEIDKISSDFHGDPASALLEVLDPEQNHAFNDHYLDVDYDLSDVMFITTANTFSIPPALLDRMEIIELSGYTEDEKVHIAQNHLLPKQFKLHGLRSTEIHIPESVIRDIIRCYTREAGVRQLERELSKICRKVVKAIAMDAKVKKVKLTCDDLEQYLGVKPYRFGEAEKEDQVGQVTGLAWTEVGGELLTVEAVALSGSGKSIVTGQIGEVMQESIQAATSVVKSRANRLGIHADLFIKNDIHVHVPEGAIPKDGPSAGITMCTALVSALTQIPIRADFAMTGEITLRGEVLPIGGLKEKLLAAMRGGVRHVIIPEENKKDLKEIPDNVKSAIEIHPVRWIDEVLKLVLLQYPSPLDELDVSISNWSRGKSTFEGRNVDSM